MRIMLHESLIEDAKAITGELVTLRRAIHAEPELGLQTPKTCEKVRMALAHLPLEWQMGKSCTGMLATLMAVYRPRWIGTFSDERYLRGG